MSYLLKLTSMFLQKTAESVVDLTDVDNFSYSAITREINKNCNEKQIKLFLSLYKQYFDEAIKSELKKPEVVALQNALVEFSKTNKIKISGDLVKSATTSELGSSEDVGGYIANVIKFLMRKISIENRQKSLNGLKQKLNVLNPNEMANKKIPNSAAIGQSITFVKNILFNHDPRFIREVLQHTIRNI